MNVAGCTAAALHRKPALETTCRISMSDYTIYALKGANDPERNAKTCNSLQEGVDVSAGVMSKLPIYTNYGTKLMLETILQKTKGIVSILSCSILKKGIIYLT